MRSIHKLAFGALATLTVVSLGVATAEARCTRLGFSVNDYGKDGPTRDAKSLLDKYIAKWAAEQGITKYNTGKKEVKCELFLDFGFFDEHTCRAEATVCWGEGSGGKNAKSQSDAPTTTGTITPKAAAPAKSKAPTAEPAKAPATDAPAAPEPARIKARAT